ncbi:unnamed protein product, partial [Pocillopora meandrina]
PYYLFNLHVGLLVPVTDNNTILDTRMTASSIHINIYYYQPYYGRLHETREFGGWCPHNKSDRSEYLQVDMGEVLLFKCPTHLPSSSSRTSFLNCIKNWYTIQSCSICLFRFFRFAFFQVFTGNSDQTSIVKYSLTNHFKATCVWFYPVTYIHWSCLRVEIFELK